MDSTNDHPLFQPAGLGDIQLSNRIVMAPMTRSRAIDNQPGELETRYYTQRATAGLIITEGTSPSANGIGYARTPGIYTAEQVNAWKAVTDAVHQQSGKIFVQLMHVGRVAHPHNLVSGGKTLAPSALLPQLEIWTDQAGLQPVPIPQAMTAAEVNLTIEEYADAAEKAIAAGFDGIEIHAANGYLPEQFLNPHTNVREDQYGGSFENRNRFVLEVTAAIINRIGKERTGIRISPFSNYNDMPSYEETTPQYEHLVTELNKLQVVYLHVVEPSARATEEGQALLRSVRDLFNGTIIRNGEYTAIKAIEALESKQADLISFGAPFVSNPDLPYRLQHNLLLTAPDVNTFFAGGEKGYIDYAFAEA
ncbi:alkene reductase [Terrimonas sp. NA20]|uniref:Alkene reductase n=1 Tax=Terrimonas ginsenosidimutans TaxID=2908004 RepID=A0ABS9KNX4_9BACT|nr:alkene reductase [Terrimonas ginsenosidimutans]MCG2614033.1 alkene reductase [Terrimonas ginsenosidimutans]